MRRRLHEALDIDGAQVLGTATGYDVYDIHSYQAACAFTANRRPASEKFLANGESDFRHINDSCHLIYFTPINSNAVTFAVLKGDAISNTDIRFYSDTEAASITLPLHINIEYSADRDTNAIFDDAPLYLISQQDPYICQNGHLKGILGSFFIEEFPEEYHLADYNIYDYIDNYAFCYGVNPEIVIWDRRVTIRENSLAGVQELGIPYSEEEFNEQGFMQYFPDGLPENVDIIWEYGLNDEEIARRAQEREERRLAAEAEEQRRREEEEAARQREIRRQAHLIRYKIVDGHAVIIGLDDQVDRIIIPETLGDHKVQEVRSYAFFEHPNLREITFPATLKHIRKNAFLDTSYPILIHIPEKCTIENVGNNIISVRRDVR